MARKLPKAGAARILWVEGRWTSNPEFIPALLQKGFQVERASSGKQALTLVGVSKHDLVIVDAASMRTNGKRICTSVRDRIDGMPILLISDKQYPVDADFECANAVLVLPFTQRKLINRIGLLLPGDGSGIQKAGPLELDLNAQTVKAQGKKTPLTPRLMKLLRMLVDNAGEVVDRDTLFKNVWRTDYTGDTRTLDVHISWLRQAIEKDPKKPKLLHTIRRVGYRLDL
ncbi:MAG: response regulator transcription factor [Anaerolineales bacterium]|nr:response regulator transcription factor [Anaerolineales bacterium]